MRFMKQIFFKFSTNCWQSWPEKSAGHIGPRPIAISASRPAIHQEFRKAENASTPDSAEYWYLRAVKRSEESGYYEALFDGCRSPSDFYIANNRFGEAEKM